MISFACRWEAGLNGATDAGRPIWDEGTRREGVFLDASGGQIPSLLVMFIGPFIWGTGNRLEQGGHRELTFQKTLENPRQSWGRNNTPGSGWGGGRPRGFFLGESLPDVQASVGGGRGGRLGPIPVQWSWRADRSVGRCAVSMALPGLRALPCLVGGGLLEARLL